MKKINKNLFLFVFAALFILIAVTGPGSRKILSRTRSFAAELLNGTKGSVASFTGDVSGYASEVRHQGMLLDLNSVKEHLLGTRVTDKVETLVVRSDADTLLGYFQTEITEDDLNRFTEEVLAVQKSAEASGAHFLYGAVPIDPLYAQRPANVESFNQSNAEKKTAALRNAGVPLIDLGAALQERGLPADETFFFTDHHWRPQAGFRAAAAIAEALSQYGFPYEAELADIGNYEVKTYPNWFLGSYGKKVGTYFTWRGADDFDLITPRFATDLSETDSAGGKERSGSFEDVLIYREYLDRDLYHKNTYVTYCGGDYRLQVITNHMKPDGPKVLLIRDSYSCVLAPFLALQAGELHIVDDREGDYPAGEKIDVLRYIGAEQFDYVLIVK